MVDTCHSVFDQAHSIYEIKTEPNLDHRIWMPTVCQCSSSSIWNAPLWRDMGMQGVTVGAVVRQGFVGTLCTFHSEPTLKIKPIF